MKTLVLVRASMQSRRCSGALLAPLAGEPLLVRMLQRVLSAQGAFEVAVVTTRDPVDDVVVRLAHTTGARAFRGHATDLLDGHYRGALEARADVVVLIPSSCALLDPIAFERVLACFVRAHGGFDYVTNLHPATWPDGNDVEVVPMALLEVAWCDAELGFEREHTTPFFWMQPDRFRIGNVKWETGLDLSRSHRFVVEHEEDVRFAQAIYDELCTSGRPIFPLGDVLDLLAARPALLEINARHGGARWYAHPPWRSPISVPAVVGA